MTLWMDNLMKKNEGIVERPNLNLNVDVFIENISSD